jgi:serine/threonine protein kinase
MAPLTRTTRRWAKTNATTPRTRATALDASTDLVLGRYRLQKPIGSGGCGTVWLARDERLQREVAVKVLPSVRVIGGRFEREARAAARLSHPGIVTLYEAEVDDDAAYLVSELVRGPTLAQLLEEGRLSDRDIVTIGIALADALNHAHAQGVVHRDVKPSNVLVPEQPASEAQVAKLTDFGVARVLGGDTLTRTGDVIGTDAYMSPEQAEGREAGPAADLYSLALVLYEALTGINPIATTTAAGRARRLGAHLPPLRRQRRDLPRELGRCIDQALRPRPRERGTVTDLRAALRAILAEVDDCPGTVEPAWPGPPQRPYLRDEPQNHQPRSRPRPHMPDRLLAAAAAALIAGWLTATAFTSPALAPAAAALIAGGTVAVLPRLGWIALTVIVAIALTADGRPGAALVVALGALLPVTLLPFAKRRWQSAALAPALGAVTLAGAWPAFAAVEPRVVRRAMLGAIGWTWLLLAGLIQGHGIYIDLPHGTPPSAQWMGSLDQTARHVLWPLLHSAALAPAVVWAAAAVVLPWIARGPIPLRVVLITVWSAALASATTTTLRLLHTGVVPRPGAVALGAIAGGIVALTLSLLRTRSQAVGSANTAPGLA